MDNNRHINRLTGGKNTMVEIDYTRKSGFVNKVRMTKKTHDGIVKEHGSIKAWLETIIHEDIVVSITE